MSLLIVSQMSGSFCKFMDAITFRSKHVKLKNVGYNDKLRGDAIVVNYWFGTCSCKPRGKISWSLSLR